MTDALTWRENRNTGGGGCLAKRWAQTQSEGSHVQVEAQVGVMLLREREREIERERESTWNPQKFEEARRALPQSLYWEHGLTNTLILNF